MRLGIDFGTTRTVVACADRGNYPVISFYDDAGDAHDFVPSVVAERDGELRFGFDALRAAGDPSFTAVRSFKRVLADADLGPGKPIRIGATTIAAGELVTRFLAWVREAILTRSNAARDARTAEGELRVVVAVPANASGAQRFVTLDAFRRAGFAPIAMLNEPSAAGFEYTHRHRNTLSSKREHVVVFDLGGGTFDASLVRMRGRAHEILDTRGVNRLGGDDFDDVLADLALAKVETARDRVGADTLRAVVDACRDAKERLNPSSKKVVIDLEGLAIGAGTAQAEAVVSVAELYEACAPLVTRAIDAMTPLMAGIEDELAGIYVVGGASELPLVARVLRERFGRRVHRSPYPSAAIAIGLAIACDESAGFELTDRYMRTFGVFREGDAGAQITFDPIFTRDTALPARSSEPLRSRRRYRAAHNLGHFRFFECDAVSDDGLPRGDIMVSGDVLFPFAPELDARADLAGVEVERLTGGRGPVIEEEYSLDENGMVAVRITNLDAGVERVFRLGATG
ncbi:MAG: Hsp70 family protein [Deltaproteobacteria bacterium]|nr:Hsp70 family protein [Deltaproteobacteria bacterium]